MNPDISNIGSILNNSVAPNVTLKRNTGSADSPLSPDYINSLVHHQRSPSFQGIVLKIFFHASYIFTFILFSGYQNNYPSNQQISFNHKPGINPSPMSPRQTNYSQPGPGNNPQAWQNLVRGPLQNNNPMLSAQLQV